MPRILSRSPIGFTHNFALDVINSVPRFFTGTFNSVAYTTGVSGQIDGTVPTAVSNGAYYVCTKPGVSNGQVFQLGHIYLGVSGVWVDQGVKDGQRMVPTTALTGNLLNFVSGAEYKYVAYGMTNTGMNKVTYPTVTPVVANGLQGSANPYNQGKGHWQLCGDLITTTPIAYVEAPSSTMRYGVGSYNIQATLSAGNVQVLYTLSSVEQIRQDPTVASWMPLATLANQQVTTVASPVTGFKLIFSATTPGQVSIVVN